MARMIDQIRASKLPSNMMTFAARGALQVSAAENIEILVHLARHNKVFGDTAADARDFAVRCGAQQALARARSRWVIRTNPRIIRIG